MSNEEVNRKNPLLHCFSPFYDTILYKVQRFQFKWDKKKLRWATMSKILSGSNVSPPSSEDVCIFMIGDMGSYSCHSMLNVGTADELCCLGGSFWKKQPERETQQMGS